MREFLEKRKKYAWYTCRGGSGRQGTDARRLHKEAGAQLFEFAVILPVLIALAIGILDFANAFTIRQKLNNAAREAARLGAAQSPADLTQINPASVQVIRDDVVTYLNNANVDTTFISSTSNKSGCCTWTYYSSGTNGLEVERQVAVPATGGGIIPSTRITINYPYNWTFGFNRIIGFLVPGATYAGTIVITTDATMQNLN